jgi:hypothetical protein
MPQAGDSPGHSPLLYFFSKRPLQIVEKKPILRDFMKKQFSKYF